MDKEELSKEIGLLEMYDSVSKHGNYQPVPDSLSGLIPVPSQDAKWRSPRPRLELLLDWMIRTPSRRILEMGSNTGFQLLSLAEEFRSTQFKGVEINAKHAEFSRQCASMMDLENVAISEDAGYPVLSVERFQPDVVLDFNVAHHVGDDIAHGEVSSQDQWWDELLPQWLEAISHVRHYWFSSGYRLHGDRGKELHPPSDPAGFAGRILDAVPGNARVNVSVFFVKPDSAQIQYQPVDVANLSKMNAMLLQSQDLQQFHGEYFKRPLFLFSPK